ncbi:substrate-binding periplasmic protein [Zooshikella harenae]|nr:transporter substrate-binding domain-containing protein [Zooshikella harenae]
MKSINVFRVTVCLMLFVAGVQTTLALADSKVYLTSLDWPPYTGKTLPDQGASVAVAKAVFAEAGLELVVDFYPWKRAVNLAKNDDKYLGYFPEYYAAELEEDFIFSEPMGSGPLGFAERKDDPVMWKTLDDLKAYKIGTVSGYVNTTEFDQMAEAGTIKVDNAGDDVKNLLKLNAGRVKLAVIDKYVMSYLLDTDPSLKKIKGKLVFNETLLEDKKLYICFRKSEKGKAIQQKFNEALKKVDVSAIMAKYLSQ